MSLRPIIAAALAVGTLAGSGLTPVAAADLGCEPVRLTCGGFEPNWQAELPGDGTIRFTDPENPDWQERPLVVSVCARQMSTGTIEIDSAAPLNFSATVHHEQCVEPNDEVRPFSVEASFIQGAGGGASPGLVSGVGCCWQE